MDRRKRARYDCVATFGAVRMACSGYLDPCICIVVRCSVEKRVTVLHDDFSSFRCVDPAGNRYPLGRAASAPSFVRTIILLTACRFRARLLGLAVRRLQLAVLSHHPPGLRDLRQHGAASGERSSCTGDGLPTANADRQAQLAPVSIRSSKANYAVVVLRRDFQCECGSMPLPPRWITSSRPTPRGSHHRADRLPCEKRMAANKPSCRRSTGCEKVASGTPGGAWARRPAPGGSLRCCPA